MSNENKPIQNFKLGGCEIAVFENEQQGKDGKHPYKSISYSVKKTYFSEHNNEWKQSNSYNRAELLQLIPLIIRAVNSIEEKEK